MQRTGSPGSPGGPRYSIFLRIQFVKKDPNHRAETAGSAVIALPESESSTEHPAALPHPLIREAGIAFRVFRDQHGRGWLQIDGATTVLDLAAPEAEVALLRRVAERRGMPRSYEVRECVEQLAAFARITTDVEPVYFRVAPVAGGVVIDVADAANTRIQVTGDGVEVRDTSGGPLFGRTPAMRPMALPAKTGDIEKLGKYVNLPAPALWLLVAWLTFCLCHACVVSVAIPILVLLGDQGSGKSFLCRLIRMLLDPSTVPIQSFPRSERDLAVAVHAQHVTVFDNMREIKPHMADALCQVATGGAFATRRLFTNRELESFQLHGALVLNTLHPNLVNQPDLAQRCLPLRLRALDGENRRREDELLAEFEEDLPGILRALLDLGSAILRELPTVRAQRPERLIGFSHWLAGLAAAQGRQESVYEHEYSAVLHAGMRDSLEEQPLIAAVLSLMDAAPSGEWSDTPTELLTALSSHVARRVQYSADWPQNPISLSKRLLAAQRALNSLGVDVQVGRRRERRIVLRRTGDDHE